MFAVHANPRTFIPSKYTRYTVAAALQSVDQNIEHVYHLQSKYMTVNVPLSAAESSQSPVDIQSPQQFSSPS